MSLEKEKRMVNVTVMNIMNNCCCCCRNCIASFLPCVQQFSDCK